MGFFAVEDLRVAISKYTRCTNPVKLVFTVTIPSTISKNMSRSSKNKLKKNPAAVALAKLGASKGGKARAVALSARQRSRIARLAAVARWAKD